MTTENVELSDTVGGLDQLTADRQPTAAVCAPRGSQGEPAVRRRRAATWRHLAPLALFAADGAATVGALLLADADQAARAVAPALGVLVALNAHAGLYRPGLSTAALDELPSLLWHTVLTWCVVTTGLVALDQPGAARWGPLLALLAAHAPLLCAARATAHLALRRQRRRAPCPALVVGSGPVGERVLATLVAAPGYGLRPVGLVAAGPAPVPAGPLTAGAATTAPLTAAAPATAGIATGTLTSGALSGPGAGPLTEPEPPTAPGPGTARDAGPAPSAPSGSVPGTVVGSAAGVVPGPAPGATPGGVADAGAGPGVPVLAGHEDISRAIAQHGVRAAVLTRTPWEDPQVAALLGLLRERRCTVWLVTAEPDPALAPARSAVPDHLWGFACRRLAPPPRHRVAAIGKRALDVCAATLGLVAVAPLLAACALAVRCSDGPGVLFRQERVGRDGRPFVVLKFRTLRSDAFESATRWSVADDQRMSAVGRWLRRTSLDELPQLWNVLRGDMSLVGPRPERPYFVREFSQRYPAYRARHRMPVGITGLAQVHGLRGDTSIEDRVRFDNHYIETWSLWQDVRILLRTAGSLFRCGGS
ncbi:exopolysaccharide biosynthesis polyprenyl glycosylphosphotransferase [Streptomyces sp. 71268]|uniref:exopolysaccharide biosynthesis polyprenyl glycosylphosphotransferase n=1 Tax=Streptomyces sp. 71268 TaxID=3002640 RepID=UPI0023F94F16|nr:exopolysaccharide biosynthesis polyprenyl glycosylphosphotransferase [Streptomyces sp. 71268]WEV24613.1 exopolysaccharide biosynthesis polyprenyl glycosylphosphotransferase [Streptomyces sp. 71268]